MNKADVKKLSNSKLIKLLLKQNVESTPKPSIKQMEKQSDITIAVTKLFSTKPRKSVKKMVQGYEDKIIPPPLEYRDRYTSVPTPRTKIEKTSKALKGCTK